MCLVPALAQADIIIVVTTASDVIANDGACSLREAIVAANTNANFSGCIGTGGGYDLIEFSIGGGTPVINIATDLPAITGPLEINGAPSRVELRGPGSGTALSISGAAASGSVVRNLVLDGFGQAISVDATSNVTIGGNRIGTNAAGTAFAGNLTGILVAGSTARIGGTNGVTPGGPCTGDCNVISGNTQQGLRVRAGSDVTVLGNFIGTDSSGMSAIGNSDGIRVENSSATIGGATAAARNLISGNSNGISFQVSTTVGGGSVVRGNRVGTNVLGSAALPNVTTGIRATLGNQDYPLAIGGSAAGEGNLVSGNSGAGIFLIQADGVTIFGNRIGTQADGTSPLPNVGTGVLLSSSTHKNLIGGTGAGQGNVIAFNATGVSIGINNYWNTVRGNSIHDNTGKGIDLPDFQNNTAVTPLLFGGNPISGSTSPFYTVDFYSDAADEGRLFEGTVTADASGNFQLNVPAHGPYITATATSDTSSTSEFSVPVPYDRDADGTADVLDNCTNTANPSQLDSDNDGYGNLCDGDLNNSGLTTVSDFNLLRSCLNKTAAASALCAAADMNGSGLVSVADYNLMRARINTAPGPSGLVP